MVDVNIRMRQTEAVEPQALFLWDTQYNADTQTWDWVPAGADEPANQGGLRVTRPLDTAVLIQLATWRRAEPYDILPDGNDPKGWWGDSVQVDEEEDRIGSRLWLLYRSVLNDDTVQRAKNYTLEALQPLIKQGAVVRFDVKASVDKTKGMLVLEIDGYSQDGAKIYNQTFSRIWSAEFAPHTPTPTFAGSVGL